MSRPWFRSRLVMAVLSVALLLSSAASATAGPAEGNDGSKKLHPKLAKLADSASDKWVDVIVSKAPNADEKAIVKAVGAKHLKSWSFTNAMHLQVPAKALKGLANNPNVNYVAPDAETRPTSSPYDQSRTAPNFQAALYANKFWGGQYVGDSIGVAVVDSGVAAHPDLADHTVNVVLPSVGDWTDGYGHGTHVAGIIAGYDKDMTHLGIAPKATIYNIRVTDASGAGKESDILSALEWIYNNHMQYNIRVINISMQSSVASSYLTSPIDGAVEKLWFAGVVVVVSAGNRGAVSDAAMYPPANDPFVITVGAFDDYATKGAKDDRVISWSSQGISQDGFAKPEILAPGRRILSTLAPGSMLANMFPAQVSGEYLSISGTSMAAPVIAGAVADMLQYQPSLTPDQVKGALLAKTRPPLTGVTASTPPAPGLDKIFDLITNPASVVSANQGLTPSTYASADTSFATLLEIHYVNIHYVNIDEEATMTPNNLYYNWAVDEP